MEGLRQRRITLTESYGTISVGESAIKSQTTTLAEGNLVKS
jgi:hypothetical protein